MVAAVLLDPDGDALGRFGHRGACQAMATLARPVRPKRLRRLGSFRRRRRREAGAVQVEGRQEVPVELPKAEPKSELSSWMAALPEQLPVSQVSMPGTHDSGTFQMWPLPVNWEPWWISRGNG